MTNKYHINPNSGIPGICGATHGRCPFGGEGDHFDNPQEAMAHFEAKLEAEEGNIKPLKKAKAVEQAAEEATTPVYDFPAYKTAYAKKQIEKANKRAERAGIKERISYELETYEKSTIDEHGFEKIEERVKLKLDRPTLKHDGWTFSGTMTWDEEVGLVTRMVPGETLISPPVAKLCDVCKTTRHRNDTYIVQKGGEQKQVGSNCLKQFMGIKPAGLWMLDYELDLKEGNDDEDPRWASYSNEYRRNSEEVLGIGLAVVEQYGWTSKGIAMETGRLSTAERVAAILANRPIGADEKRSFPGLVKRGKELSKEAAEVLAKAKSIEGNNDYADNLRIVSSGETVSARNMPLLLSAIGHAEREKAKEAKAKVTVQSQWVGKVDNKISLPKVKIEEVKVIPGSGYGYNSADSKLITMRDEDGNVFKTFYSGSNTPKAGTSMVLKSAVIKKHQEWNGVKETMLGRIKLESVRPDTLPPTKLSADSPYTKSWTVEENAKMNSAELRKIKKAIKKKAGADGWDDNWDRPKDSALTREWDELERKTNKEFSQRYTELTGEE